MKIPLVQGRIFDEHDKSDAVRVVLINQTMAHRFWPNQNPAGLLINIDDNNTGPRPVEIVGVVGDVKHVNLESEPTSDIYLPLAQMHEDGVPAIVNNQYWVVRSTIDRLALEAAFRRELQALDRDVATSDLKPLEDYMSESIAPRRFNLRVLSIFSVAALLLAATGIYGVVSYIVSQRTPEMGIRLALGAGRKNIFRLILSEGLRVVFIGVGLGALGAIALTRLIRSMLFGIAPTDIFTFALVSFLLILVALIACAVPARRATHINPSVALRNE